MEAKRKRYRCRTAFQLMIYDDDGSSTDQYRTIPEGSEWEEDPEDYRFVANRDSARLYRGELETGGEPVVLRQWIEITPERLRDYFEEIA